jgi:catechol 2,3-dioxygenase-like lactoylglutathione lyase family enzyme
MTAPTAAPAHHGMTVASIDAALGLFVGVLGFTPSERIELDEEFSAGVTGVEGARISVVFVETPGLAVELLSYAGTADRPVHRPRPCDPGAAHLALYVDDLDAVAAAAEGAGWRLAGSVMPITTGPRKGGRAAYLTDAGGSVVELVQRP